MTHPDTIATTKDKLTWYHWNHINTTYYNDTMKGQGVDPACPGCTDMFTHRAFGAQVSATGLSGGGLTLSGTGLSSVDVQITQLTMVVDDPSTWLSEVAKVTPAPSAASAEALGKETATSWSEISERSYIELSGSGANAATAKKITDHVNWDRYLSLIQGRVAFAPIKFNGRKRNRHHFALVHFLDLSRFLSSCAEAFNCNDTGKGWDMRGWGADYWWQNERQPYYNVLAQGDLDTMRSFLDFVSLFCFLTTRPNSPRVLTTVGWMFAVFADATVRGGADEGSVQGDEEPSHCRRAL